MKILTKNYDFILGIELAIICLEGFNFSLRKF
jgi:hypothetical protein